MKTLKDLEADCLFGGGEVSLQRPKRSFVLIPSIDLKEVAQEWVQELERSMDKDDDPIFNIDGVNYNVVEWIKHFFNLEEKE